MAKRPFKHAANSQDIFKKYAAQKLRLCGNLFFFDTSAQKLMFWELWYAIGNNYTTLRIPMKWLAKVTRISLQSAYRVAEELSEDFGVIRYSPAKRNSGEHPEFEIRWAHVVCRHAAAKAEWEEDDSFAGVIDDCPTPTGENPFLTDKNSILVDEKPILTDKTPVLVGEVSFLAHKKSFLTHEKHIMNSGVSSEYTSESSSTPANDEDDARRVVVLRLMDCGVSLVGETADAALAQGMTFDQIHAVIDHYQAEANSGRWSPGQLVKRLTQPDMYLAPVEKCWPDGSPEWQAAQKRKAQAEQTKLVHEQLAQATQRTAKPSPEADEAAKLEAEHGPTLDAMTAEERKGLVSTFTATMQQWIAKAGDEAHKSKLYRRAFLEALKARTNQ